MGTMVAQFLGGDLGGRMLWALTDCLVSRGPWRRLRDHWDVVALNVAPALVSGRQFVTATDLITG